MWEQFRKTTRSDMKILKARFKLIIVDDMGVDDFAKINFTKLCPDKTQLSSARPNQRQCPEFLLHLKSTILRIPRWLPCGHPGSLACSQLLSCFRLPPEAARGAGTTIGLVVSRVIQSPAASCCACKGTSRCFPRSERDRERDSPGGHGPWAGSGHVALGKDRPAHLPSAGPEQQPHAREKFLCSLGLY